MIKFLTKELTLLFHEDLIQRYGGSHGVRDENLLDSALAQPKSMFEGRYLHKSIYEMAAAYGYHLCQNHPFIDGNKRIALTVMYTFLYVNGHRIKLNEKEAYLLIMSIADGSLSKQELADYLKRNSSKVK